MAHLFWCPWQAFAVKFSPYPCLPDELLAVATGQHFGMAGNGRVHVLRLTDASGFTEVSSFYAQEAVFDVVWSEACEHHLVGVCGDGAVLLWDLRATDGRPIGRWKDHSQEVVGVAWALGARNLFATASWDGAVRLYDTSRPGGGGAVAALTGHTGAVNSVEWHPVHAHTLASGGAGAEVCVWDARVGAGGPALRVVFNGAAGDILSLDWNRYREHDVLVGGADGAVRAWDVRRTRTPTHIMAGHALPVRRVRCSPHEASIVASASYDFSVCLWDIGDAAALQGALVQRASHHREFATGVDWALFRPGIVASCGWDRAVIAWRPAAGAPPALPPRPLPPQAQLPP